jgi:glyoxylase-like metal-dependent hydrolase (beta-lactamase superfamily II)
MNLSWQIGDVKITRIVEVETATSPRFLFPQLSKADVLSVDWLQPHFATEDGYMLMSIHALIVESAGQVIVVDTCLGNDKPRAVPGWDMRSGPFLEDIAAAGYPRESVDTVLCTHLHVDHVGWNTMWVDEQWVPTFPKARYIFGREEWAYWSVTEREDYGPIIADSVRPIVDAGLVDLVETDHKITDEVWLEPTPGHTPGHVSVHILSRGEEAIITGDMTHHPCQMAHPSWAASVDYDQTESTKTREAFYAKYGDRHVLIIGTHFAAPTAGMVVTDGEAWRFQV